MNSCLYHLNPTKMKRIVYSIVVVLFATMAYDGYAQGCVAVKNMSSCSLTGQENESNGFQFSLNYRYFKSYKHFRGSHEETHRVEQGTEVINRDNSVLLGMSYTLNKKWSFGLTLPYMSIDRSSKYEHYGNNPATNPRFSTQSKGIGDIRLSAYYSAIQEDKFHLTAGFGFKLPTGNFKVKDYFHKRDVEGGDSLAYGLVDQSIQLGDGGFGYTVEFSASYMASHSLSIYGAGMYLFNPRNTNGIERRPNLTAGIPLSNHFSVSDQLFMRLGAQVQLNSWQVALGGRIEGIPSEDLIGKSDGFRRPGYIISAEPSLYYTAGQHSVGVNLPIALVRNRTQNTTDKRETAITGEYNIGDAAFADWLLSITYTYRLQRK